MGMKKNEVTYMCECIESYRRKQNKNKNTFGGSSPPQQYMSQGCHSLNTLKSNKSQSIKRKTCIPYPKLQHCSYLE